jgi:hypothetical protein
MNTRFTNRATGILVTPLDLTADMDEALTAYKAANPDTEMTEARTEDGWALACTPDGTEYLVCSEGVGYPLAPANDFDVWLSSEHSFQVTPAMSLQLTAEEVHERATGEPVDLADHIRVFGQRLEDNFWLWHNTLSH